MSIPQGVVGETWQDKKKRKKILETPTAIPYQGVPANPEEEFRKFMCHVEEMFRRTEIGVDINLVHDYYDLDNHLISPVVRLLSTLQERFDSHKREVEVIDDERKSLQEELRRLRFELQSTQSAYCERERIHVEQVYTLLSQHRVEIDELKRNLQHNYEDKGDDFGNNESEEEARMTKETTLATTSPRRKQRRTKESTLAKTSSRRTKSRQKSKTSPKK